jgi:hypothetical protein
VEAGRIREEGTMAILMIADASEQLLAHYDQVIADLEAAGLGHPPGRLFHAAARKGAGYVVTDVWESQEALDAFFQTLGPLLQQAGGDAAQQATQILPVHNLIQGS